MYGILVLCLILRPMAVSSNNNSPGIQPSNDAAERRARDGVYIGCYPQECLKVGFYEVLLESITPDSCTAECKDNGFRVAALYNRTKCACSCEQTCHEKLQPPPKNPNTEYCGLPCKNNSDIFCGGLTGVSFYIVKSVKTSNKKSSENTTGSTDAPGGAGDPSVSIEIYIAAGIGSAVIIVLIIIFACLRKSDHRVVYSPSNHSRRLHADAPSEENEQRPPNDPQTTSNQPRLPPRNMSGTHQSSCIESASHTQTRRDGEPAIVGDTTDSMPVMEFNFYHVLTEEDGEETRSQCLSLAPENAYAYADCRAYMDSFPRPAAGMPSQADTSRCPEYNEEVEHEMINDELYAISKK